MFYGGEADQLLWGSLCQMLEPTNVDSSNNIIMSKCEFEYYKIILAFLI